MQVYTAGKLAGAVRALLEKLIETQMDVNINDEDNEEMHGLNDYAENNRRLEYGKRTKRVKHQSVDMYEQSSLNFDDRTIMDAEHAEAEREERERNSEEARQWLEENSDGERPYGMEW